MSESQPAGPCSGDWAADQGITARSDGRGAPVSLVVDGEEMAIGPGRTALDRGR